MAAPPAQRHQTARSQGDPGNEERGKIEMHPSQCKNFEEIILNCLIIFHRPFHLAFIIPLFDIFALIMQFLSPT